MLIESLNALIAAGNYAMRTICGLPVLDHEITQIRQGSLNFPALGELHIKNGPLQSVHLGCDSQLSGRLAGPLEGHDNETGIEAVTAGFLQRLLEEMEARNPRGEVQLLDAGPVNLVSRGVRSFGIRLETGAGRFFILVEVPSRIELELAKGSDFFPLMEAKYLPQDWETRQAIDGQLAIENFLVFLRKAEGDVSFEIPGDGDFHYLHSGTLLDNGTFGGERGLKFCTDLSQTAQAGLHKGDVVRATVGLDDRSLQFTMSYLGAATHRLQNGAELPCAFFVPPQEVTITQRRLAFRIPVSSEIQVELHCGNGANEVSPWGDQDAPPEPLIRGTLGDLSFSGACVVTDEMGSGSGLEINRRVVCDIHFPDADEPLSVLSVVRRNMSRLVGRHDRRHEIGLEFLIFGDADRTALDDIRQFVLAEQRALLSRRIHVGGISA